MEILLLIIAGIVLYMLYNSFSDYMKNPYKIPAQDSSEGIRAEYRPQDNPYIQLTDEDRIKKTEFGILAQILALIAQSDGKICALEKELIKDLLDDMAKELNEYNDYKDARGSLQTIFDETQNANLDALAEAFAESTKGEYKKRVKVVEFLFALAYSDGVLDENEREKIIDVAAIFELNNDDFNKIYDDFERKYAQNLSLTKANALKILGLKEGFISSDLENAYHEKIKEKKQNIFKSLNKSFDNDILREIDSAYKMLKNELDSAQSAESVKNNPCEAPENSPASWCKKSESKGAVVPPADFLLEAEKRGTPPKSEKRQLLARRGSGEGGAALLREKTSEISGEGGAESSTESQGGLPRRFCESARNDEILDSSLRLRSAQNDNMGLDSSPTAENNNNAKNIK